MLLLQMWDPTPVESIMFAAIRKFLLAVFSYATLLGISDTRAWVRVGFHLVASESLKTRIEWTHKLFLLQALQSLGIPRAMEMNVAPHTLGHPWFYMGYRSSFTTSGDREGPANDFCFGATNSRIKMLLCVYNHVINEMASKASEGASALEHPAASCSWDEERSPCKMWFTSDLTISSAHAVQREVSSRNQNNLNSMQGTKKIIRPGTCT